MREAYILCVLILCTLYLCWTSFFLLCICVGHLLDMYLIFRHVFTFVWTCVFMFLFVMYEHVLSFMT